MKPLYKLNKLFLSVSISVIFFVNKPANSQSITDYNFTATSGTYEPLPAGTELKYLEADENLISAIPIGFDFWYIGSRYTQLSASSNGYLSFDDSYLSPVPSNDLDGSIMFTSSGRPAIAPLWDDLDGSTPSSKASYNTTGVYPNRIFTFEWLNWEWGKNANQPVISFQVKLYELDGKIEFIYRQETGAVNSGTASIGITDMTIGTGTFLSLDETGAAPNVSSSIESETLNTKPATGQVYCFTPAAPAAPSNLTFTNITKTSMRLNWTDNSNNEDGFVIYHSTDNISFEYIDRTDAGIAYITIDNLETGILNYWKVYSRKGALSTSAAGGSRVTLNGTMSGTYIIGSGLPYNYRRISDALTDIYLDGLSGPVVLELKSDYNSSLEWSFPINMYSLGASGDRTITIRPASNAHNLIITTSENSPTIEMSTDYVIIDGRPGGIGTTSELTIANTYTGGSPAIRFYNDASHNTIRYCRLKADNPSVTGGVVHFTETFVGQYSYGQRYNSIENCEVNCNKKSANGIYSSGFSAADCQNKYNTIRNNNIYDFFISGTSTATTSGINLAAGNSDWTITGNNIYQTTGNSYSSSASSHYGIIIKNTGANFNVENNSIGGSSGNCGGNAWNVTSGNYNFTGIYVYGTISSDPVNVIIQKNKITNFSIGSSTASITGINIEKGVGSASNNFISLGQNCGGSIVVKGIETGVARSFNFYYNSVYLGGANTSGSGNSYAFVRNSYASVKLFNNIFFNGRTGGSGHHYAIGNILTEISTNYNWPGETSDYNLLVCSNSSYAGLWGGSPQNFAGWKTVSGGDNHSIHETSGSLSSDNLFTDVSSGNLHINSANEAAWFVNGKGYPVAVATDDIDGNSRSSLVTNGSTDLGADEFVPSSNPPAASATGLPANNTSCTYTHCAQTVSSITWGAAGVVPVSVVVKYFSGSQPPGSLTGNYSNCYWEFIPDGGSGYVYDLTLHYDENQLGSISSEDQIKIAKRDGGAWQHLTDAVVDAVNNTVTITGLHSFSQFALSDQSSPLPVELSGLTVIARGSTVRIKWSTSAEINSFSFTIQRKGDKKVWVDIKEVPAAGNSSSAKNYLFLDEVTSAGQYFYRLKMIDNGGIFKYSGEVETFVGVPAEFKVSQNYPNPFNPQSVIDFQLPFEGNVKVVLYSVTGEEVKTILNEKLPAGFHKFSIHGNDLSSGIYFCLVSVNDPAGGENKNEVRKVVLLK